jgi:TolB protein
MPSRVSFVVAALFLAAGCLTAADRIEGTIEKLVKVESLPIRVSADQPELERLAQQAFSAHGGFRLENSASAPNIRFAVTGANAVQVTISGAAAFAQNVTGTSLRHALLRAADAAVLHLTRRPGFFAGQIAFVSERTGHGEVYTSDLFFGEMLQRTNDRSQVVTPRWSPDGRRIVYTSYWRNGFPDIYVLDTATNRRDVFVSIKGTNTGARFSPDGQRVAMILSGEGNPEVYLANAQGKLMARLTRTERQIEATPSWSADGTRLVVASDGLATGKPQLYLLGATANSSMDRLPTNISGYCAEPDWSHADPDLIAFTVASGGSYEVAVYSLSERKAEVVTSGSGDAIEPCWLPDGRHVLFTARSAGSSRICIVDTRSKRTTTLSPAGLGKAYQASYVRR